MGKLLADATSHLYVGYGHMEKRDFEDIHCVLCMETFALSIDAFKSILAGQTKLQ